MQRKHTMRAFHSDLVIATYSVILSGVFVREQRMKTQSKDLVLSRPVHRFRRYLVLVLAVYFFASSLPSPAQTPLSQILQPPAASTSANPRTDPLNRTTPSGAILGFLQAAQSGDYSIAAQYLQMSAARRQSEGEQLAAQLKAVLDRAFTGRLGSYTQPEGIPQEGVPLGRQKLGTMASGDVEVDLDLARVSDPSAGKIWLISSDTLVKVPELYDQVEARQVESRLPAVLVKHQLGGMPLWQWLALLVAAPVAAGIGWLVLVLLEIPVRWWARRRGAMDVANWRSVSGPAWLLAGTLVHQVFARYLGMPLLPRHYYFQITSVALIISATWIVWRVVRWSLRRVRNRALTHGHLGTGSLMLLGERVIKAIIFMVGVFAVLGSLGFNMSTALAGLGITGLAIGFGAQKTIENLFGGVSILGDEVLRVGDVCRISDRTGTVEDIGLRSTRLRTDERTCSPSPTAPWPPSTSRTSAAATRFCSRPLSAYAPKPKPITCASCSLKSAACCTAIPRSSRRPSACASATLPVARRPSRCFPTS